MPEYCRKTENECYGKKELNLLFEISTLLNSVSRDLTEVFKPVTRLLAEHLNAERVFLSILNRTNSQISIEVSHGLTDEEQSKGVYKIGEGINGRVVETGIPVVIPKIADDRAFLNRTGSAGNCPPEDTSFICVPIK